MVDYYKEHARLYVSIDCIVLGFDEGKLKLLIGHRKMDLDGASGRSMVTLSMKTRVLTIAPAGYSTN